MTRSAKPLGIGIVGCGNVMKAYLRIAEKLQLQGLARVVAACGRQHDRQRVMSRLREASYYTEDQALIASPDVDIVVILTPTSTHAALATSALSASKHVLVEKPFATNMEDAAKLINFARHSNCHLLCAPFTCLSPTFQAIGHHLQRGDIGTVVSARGRYGWAGPDWSDWFFKQDGGAIFDLAIYNITTLTGWLGPVRRVGAMVGTAIPYREIGGKRVAVETDDNAQVLLDFGDARFAIVTSGYTIQQYRAPGIELYGTEGTIQMLGDDWNPNGYEMWLNSAGCWQCYNETHPDWRWADGLTHLVECVHSGRRPDERLEHSLHVVEVMQCAKEAGRNGTLVNIQSTFAPLAFGELPRESMAHRIHDRTRV